MALKTDTKMSTSDLNRRLGVLMDRNVGDIHNDERYALLDDEKFLSLRQEMMVRRCSLLQTSSETTGKQTRNLCFS